MNQSLTDAVLNQNQRNQTMKNLFLSTLALLGLTAASLAHGDIKVGPTNGRLLTEVEPHVEFLVTKARTVELRFVDDANKVVTPAGQEITVTLGERSNPTKLTFKQEGDKLVSSGPIPAGDEMPTVVQIRPTKGQKP